MTQHSLRPRDVSGIKEKRDPDFSKYPKRRVCYETIVL